MIVVNLMGGLGNQLFQYAAGRSLAIHHGVELKYVFSDSYPLAKRSVRIDKYEIEAAPFQADPGNDYLPKRKLTRVLYKLLGLNYDGRIYRETLYYDFDPAFFGLPDKTYLYGFWQSYAYFENIGDRIRKEVMIKNPSAKYLNAVDHIRSLMNPLSIHVRRGDYLNVKSGFSSVSESYYEVANRYAMDRFGNYTPVVFTDDNLWVKNHLNFLKEPVFASDFQLEDFEELMLMSQCLHHIIANSSFSWWGAWLNSNPDKWVVAPRQWHSLHADHSKLIPPGWIKIPDY